MIKARPLKDLCLAREEERVKLTKGQAKLLSFFQNEINKMSHSVHPYAFRINILRDWKSRWFGVGKKYKTQLKTDIILREWLEKKLEKAYIENIDLERLQSFLHIIIKTSRPGILIGRKGEGAEKLKKDIKTKLKTINASNNSSDVKLTIEEIKDAESRAPIVAKMVKEELEKRRRFRKVLKKSIEKSMGNRNVKGIKIALSGRLDGADMGRREWLKKGKIPLQTLRSDVDFYREKAHLPYGDIGIKVWIYRGEIFEK